MSTAEKNVSTFITAMIIIIIFYGIIYYIRNKQEENHFRNRFGEDMFALCATPPENPRRDSFPTEQLQLLVLEGNELSDWYNDLPDILRADNREELNVVACVTNGELVRMQTCSYSFGGSIRRFRQTKYVTLYSAKSSNIITRFQVFGSPPGSCREYVGTDSRDSKTGSLPNGYDFQEALQLAIPR